MNCRKLMNGMMTPSDGVVLYNGMGLTFTLSDKKGVRILHLTKDGPAEKSGLLI